MKAKTKFNFLFFLLFSTIAFSQLDTYNCKREIIGITEQWHSLVLPNSVFTKVSNDLSDIRIYNVSANDTVEAPYILKVASEKRSLKKIDFKLINVSNKKDWHYFTYEIPSTESINEVLLDFENKNFDWQIVLEASQNQEDWFTLLENYRILAINNEQTDYKFTSLKFPDSKYRYYRLSFKSDVKPELRNASINLNEKINAQYHNFTISDFNIVEDEESKQTILTVDMQQRLPISFVKIEVGNDFDYYRPITLEYISDSVETEKGWKYNYRTLYSGTLNSIEQNEFKFDGRLAKKLRITIQNHDNHPLKISDITVKGHEYKLVARFTEPGKYYLVYGKRHANKPQYDIAQSSTKIPKSIPNLTLGSEHNIPKKQPTTVSPLFENKLWLWSVMGVIILVLAVFTLKMMGKK